MSDVLRNVDAMLKSAADYGPWVRAVNFPSTGSNVTAATSTSGYLTGRRYGTIACPTLGAGIKGMYLVQCRLGHLCGGASVVCMAGIEYDMGTLTVSGNTFADGVAMPTKTVRGASLQTAALFPVVYIATTLVATTPVLTITYTNQNSVASHTATMTLPTNAAVNSLFPIQPHFQSGDSGVQDITGLSISTGTGGSIKVLGLLPIAVAPFDSFVQGQNAIDTLAAPWPMWLVESGENIGVWRFGRTTFSEGILMSVVGIAQPA